MSYRLIRAQRGIDTPPKQLRLFHFNIGRIHRGRKHTLATREKISRSVKIAMNNPLNTKVKEAHRKTGLALRGRSWSKRIKKAPTLSYHCLCLSCGKGLATTHSNPKNQLKFCSECRNNHHPCLNCGSMVGVERIFCGHSCQLSWQDKNIPKPKDFGQRISKGKKNNPYHESEEKKLQRAEKAKLWWKLHPEARELAAERAASRIKKWIRPTKIEIFLNTLLNKYFPNQWKYVGDGQLIIGGKCPDFANIDGRKDLIELFGNYWHAPSDKEKRTNHFSKYGYRTLVIWENELDNEENIIKIITEFTGNYLR